MKTRILSLFSLVLIPAFAAAEDTGVKRLDDMLSELNSRPTLSQQKELLEKNEEQPAVKRVGPHPMKGTVETERRELSVSVSQLEQLYKMMVNSESKTQVSHAFAFRQPINTGKKLQGALEKCKIALNAENPRLERDEEKCRKKMTEARGLKAQINATIEQYTQKR